MIQRADTIGVFRIESRALNHLAHSIVPIVAGALGSAFGVTPVFVMTAAVLAASGYLGGKVKSSAQV